MYKLGNKYYEYMDLLFYLLDLRIDHNIKIIYSDEEVNKLIEKNRAEVNKILPEFGRISGFTIQKEEFIKSPTQKIKRFLYN